MSLECEEPGCFLAENEHVYQEDRWWPHKFLSAEEPNTGTDPWDPSKVQSASLPPAEASASLATSSDQRAMGSTDESPKPVPGPSAELFVACDDCHVGAMIPDTDLGGFTCSCGKRFDDRNGHIHLCSVHSHPRPVYEDWCDVEVGGITQRLLNSRKDGRSEG